MNDIPSEWGHRFYMKSAFVTGLPERMVAASVEHVNDQIEGIDGVVSIWTCGGAIADVPEEATAFTGRDGAYWASAEVLWEDADLDEAAREWGRRLRRRHRRRRRRRPLRQRRRRGGRGPARDLRRREAGASGGAQTGMGS